LTVHASNEINRRNKLSEVLVTQNEAMGTHVVYFKTGYQHGRPTLNCSIGQQTLSGASFQLERELKNVIPRLGGRLVGDEVDLDYPVFISAAQLIDAGFDPDKVRAAMNGAER
jgi:hypothetical protein